MGTRFAEDRESVDYSLNDGMATAARPRDDMHQNDEGGAPIGVDDTERRAESE
jgi:hypothetical protein